MYYNKTLEEIGKRQKLFKFGFDFSGFRPGTRGLMV
jgi:hypothetical protein